MISDALEIIINDLKKKNPNEYKNKSTEDLIIELVTDENKSETEENCKRLDL